MSEVEDLRSELQQLAQELGIEHPASVGRLFRSWVEVVGEEVGRRLKPRALKAGVLRVAASSSAWAAEVRYLAPELIRRINGFLGEEAVRDLEVVVRPGTEDAGSPRKGPQTNDRLHSGDIDPGDLQSARDMASEIPDPEVAEAAKRAYLAGQMRRRRGG